MKFLFLLLFLSCLLFPELGAAQKRELGFSVGATNYKGDFTNDNFNLINFRPAILAYYRNNISPAFSMRYNLMAGGISSNDAKANDQVYKARSQSFTNILYELSGQLEYNFLNYRSSSNPRKWSPYFFGGIGMFYFSPYSAKTSNYSPVQPVIPIGIGLKTKILENWNISLEAGARKTFTDYLDNTSELVPGSDPGTSDWYLFTGVSVSYTFYSVFCPRFRLKI